MQDNGNKFGFNWEGLDQFISILRLMKREKNIWKEKSDWPDDEEKETPSGMGGKFLKVLGT